MTPNQKKQILAELTAPNAPGGHLHDIVLRLVNALPTSKPKKSAKGKARATPAETAEPS